MRRSAWLVAMLATTAGAQTFAVEGEVGLDVVWARRVDPPSGDLVVNTRTVAARRGVRCGDGPFLPQAVVVLDRDCEVRVAGGETRTFRLSLAGGTLLVALRPGHPVESVRAFGEARLWVNGRPSATRMGALVLYDDGRYRLGRTEGRWWRLGDAYAFDGALSTWGRARLGEEGLCLGLLRGPLEYQLCFPVAGAEVAGR